MTKRITLLVLAAAVLLGAACQPTPQAGERVSIIALPIGTLLDVHDAPDGVVVGHLDWAVGTQYSATGANASADGETWVEIGLGHGDSGWVPFGSIGQLATAQEQVSFDQVVGITPPAAINAYAASLGAGAVVVDITGMSGVVDVLGDQGDGQRGVRHRVETAWSGTEYRIDQLLTQAICTNGLTDDGECA